MAAWLIHKPLSLRRNMDYLNSSSPNYYKLKQRKLDRDEKRAEETYRKNKSQISIPEICDLDRKVNSLCMVVEALSELLEEHGISKELIERKVEEIDLRDGVLDGQNIPISSCRKCKRKTKSQRPICMYCGGKVIAT